MKKIVYGFMLAASIAGTYAKSYCPEKLTKTQMNDLVNLREVDINGEAYQADMDDKLIIEAALKKVQTMSQALSPFIKAENVEKNNTTESNGKVVCSYEFRSASQKFKGGEPTKFKIWIQASESERSK